MLVFHCHLSRKSSTAARLICSAVRAPLLLQLKQGCKTLIWHESKWHKQMKISCKKKKKEQKMNLSLSSQIPSGIVGRPGGLKWLFWRFCAVFFDTIHTSLLLSGLLHSLEQYSVMHLATSCLQRCISPSLICKDRWDTSSKLLTLLKNYH